VFIEGLVDLDDGDAEGLTPAERSARYPVLWRQHQERRYADFAWPGGETLCQFRDRCLEAVEWITSRHPAGAPIWLLAPAGVISQVGGHLLGIGPEVWDGFWLQPGETWEVEWLPERRK
jgi:broad specificity phosphatase PhoE